MRVLALGWIEANRRYYSLGETGILSDWVEAAKPKALEEMQPEAIPVACSNFPICSFLVEPVSDSYSLICYVYSTSPSERLVRSKTYYIKDSLLRRFWVTRRLTIKPNWVKEGF